MTNSNPLIRKVGTNHTQIAPCIRLHPIKPQHQINDLEIIDPKNITCDPSIQKAVKEPEFMGQQIDRLDFLPFARMPHADQTTSSFHFHGKEKLSNCHPHNRLMKTPPY